MVNKRIQNTVAGCNLKYYRMISVRFQGKPFNIMVFQVYALTSNAEEGQIEETLPSRFSNLMCVFVLDFSVVSDSV